MEGSGRNGLKGNKTRGEEEQLAGRDTHGKWVCDGNESRGAKELERVKGPDQKDLVTIWKKKVNKRMCRQVSKKGPDIF